MARILIVEDDADVLKVVQARLKASGFKTIVTQDGQEALDEVYKQKPDLIVLDLMLPKVDGTSVCNQLKRQRRYSKVPILMLTAKDKEIDIALGDIAGADAYITKPFDSQELISKIKELLKKTKKLKK